jgi:hypothetical protein
MSGTGVRRAGPSAASAATNDLPVYLPPPTPRIGAWQWIRRRDNGVMIRIQPLAKKDTTSEAGSAA